MHPRACRDGNKQAACALHAAVHPRVAVFQGAAELVEEASSPPPPERWSDAKLEAYLTLYDSLAPWLGAGGPTTPGHATPGHASPRGPEPPASPRTASPRTSPRTPRSAAAAGAGGAGGALAGGGAAPPPAVSELPLEFVEVLLQRCVRRQDHTAAVSVVGSDSAPV